MYLFGETMCMTLIRTAWSRMSINAVSRMDVVRCDVTIIFLLVEREARLVEGNMRSENFILYRDWLIT